MSRFGVIIAAAGRSTRFKAGRRKKPFLDLKGRALWVRCADVFSARDDVSEILVTVADSDLDWFKETFRANLAFMNVTPVPGGKERADSVQNALARISGESEYVAVHDAARPLVTRAEIDRVFHAAIEEGAAILASPIASTVKRVGGKGTIEETVPREGLWAAQTPQVFRTDLLREAYARRDGFIATDEAQLVERLGHPVRVVEGSADNFKITTQADFRLAEAILGSRPENAGKRPLHPFAEGPGGLFD